MLTWFWYNDSYSLLLSFSVRPAVTRGQLKKLNWFSPQFVLCTFNDQFSTFIVACLCSGAAFFSLIFSITMGKNSQQRIAIVISNKTFNCCIALKLTHDRTSRVNIQNVRCNGFRHICRWAMWQLQCSQSIALNPWVARHLQIQHVGINAELLLQCSSMQYTAAETECRSNFCW